MAEQNIFSRMSEGVKSFLLPAVELFDREDDGVKKVKEVGEDIGAVLGPPWREIPPDSNGNKIITEGFKGWSYVAVSAIADEVAATALYLYARKGENWTIKERHPVMDLMNKPNGYQTGEEFRWLLTGHLLALAEALLITNKEKNPDQMILFNPSRVTPVFDDVTHTIEKYKILQADGKYDTVPANRCVFIKLPSFENPFRGTGVMEYITRVIDTDNFIQDYVRIFFYNNARPNGVLQTDNEISQDHGSRILAQWNARNRGVKNQHKTAILDKGLKFVSIDQNMQQLEMAGLDLRIMNRVLSAFKVPKSVVGISEDVNRANADAASYTFSRRAVLPKLKMIEAQLNQYLLPMFSDGANLWFEFESPVREDQLIEAQVEEIRIRSGVRTANEYRAEDGLEALPEKEPMSDPLQLSLSKMKQEKLNQRINSRKVLTPIEKKLRGIEDAIWDEAKKIVEKKYEVKMNIGPFTESEVAEYHVKKLENSDKIEKDFIDRVYKNQARQLKDILAQLSGKSKKQKATLVIDFDEEEEADILAQLAVPYMERSILAQAALSAALLDIDNTLDTQDNRVRNFIKRWTVKLGKSNAETTHKVVNDKLKEWAANEDASIADLKQSLKEYFGETAPAERIARTEVSRASGYATQTVYQDAGAVGKKWIAAIDERVCPICNDLDGQVTELSGFFDTIDGDSVQHEPAHPNCRCDITPVFENGKEAENVAHSFASLTQKLLEKKEEETEDKK